MGFLGLLVTLRSVWWLSGCLWPDSIPQTRGRSARIDRVGFPAGFRSKLSLRSLLPRNGDRPQLADYDPPQVTLCRWTHGEKKKPPEGGFQKFVARPRRFERPTLAFGGQYSIQLSYGRAGAGILPPAPVRVQSIPPRGGFSRRRWRPLRIAGRSNGRSGGRCAPCRWWTAHG